jgi:hypothetical protein
MITPYTLSLAIHCQVLALFPATTSFYAGTLVAAERNQVMGVRFDDDEEDGKVRAWLREGGVGGGGGEEGRQAVKDLAVPFHLGVFTHPTIPLLSFVPLSISLLFLWHSPSIPLLFPFFSCGAGDQVAQDSVLLRRPFLRDRVKGVKGPFRERGKGGQGRVKGG